VHFKAFFFGKTPSRALLVTQRKTSHFKGSESDTQKTQENDTCCGAWRDQAASVFAKKGGFCNFDES